MVSRDFYRLLVVVSIFCSVAGAAPKFTTTGPVLSLTLRDPFATTSDSTSGNASGSGPSSSSSLDVSASITRGETLRVTSLSNLDPCATWSINSNGPPFPVRIPSLQSISSSITYQYNLLKALPSTLSAKINLGGQTFFKDRIKVQIQPNIQVKSGAGELSIQVASENENHVGWIKTSNKGGNIIDQIRTSHKFSLPFTAMSSVTITPSFDFRKSTPSCLLSGETGSGRTAAIIDLNIDDPTLAVVHALDDRNIISPEISLHSAKIMYNWDVTLNSGSIRTKVDPTSSIQVTWMDKTSNGEWVTDFHLPLVGVRGPLAADIKVRRQFIF